MILLKILQLKSYQPPEVLINKESFLFDELPEPLRDRLILAMADIQKARSHVYDKEGRLIRGLEEKVILKNSSSFKNKILI